MHCQSLLGILGLNFALFLRTSVNELSRLQLRISYFNLMTHTRTLFLCMSHSWVFGRFCFVSCVGQEEDVEREGERWVDR